MPKVNELRDQSLEELKIACEDAYRSLFTLRNQFAVAGEKVKPHEMRAAKKNIARMLTIIGEKDRQAQ